MERMQIGSIGFTKDVDNEEGTTAPDEEVISIR